MADLTVSEVVEIVKGLEDNSDHKAMRDDAAEKHKVIQMLKVNDLPDHMTRGVGVSEPSPYLLWLRGTISADIMPYPTIPTVTPLGDTSKPAQEQADKLEKWIATWRSTVDDGRRVGSDVLDNQLLSPYAVMILRCGSPDDEFPWEVETPDPMTCFFPIQRAPFRPEILARRYTQTVRRIEKSLSRRKQWNSDKGSWTSPPSNFFWKDGEWTYVKVGEGRQSESGTSTASSAGPFEECEVLELHIEDRIYIVAMNAAAKNKGKPSGEMVWSGKSMTGGVSAVVVPGVYSAVGPVSERMQAALWPAIQMVHRINGINAERASRSQSLKPDILVEQTPEALRAQQTAGTLAQGQNAALEAGGPNIINVNGRAVPWELQADPDLDKREQSAWKELQQYTNSWTEVSEPEIVKDATANGFLSNLESKKRQKAPILAHRDWGWRELAKMGLRSIVEYGQQFSVYATKGDEYKDAKKGEGQTIGPSDVDEWEDKYWLEVETKSTTEAESRARVQDWAYRKGLGLSTQRGGITAAGYTDEGQQIERLAVEAGIATVSDPIKQQVVAAVQERIRLRAGILIQMGQPAPTPGGPGAGTAPGGTGGGTEPMRPALVPGPGGGSGAAPV